MAGTQHKLNRVYKPIQCLDCGQTFRPNGSKQRRCTICGPAYKRRRENEWRRGGQPSPLEKPVTKCRRCSTSFIRSDRSQRYCSEACRKEMRRDRRREKYANDIKEYRALPVGWCEDCGKSFQRRARKRFCSACAKKRQRAVRKDARSASQHTKKYYQKNREELLARRREKRRRDNSSEIAYNRSAEARAAKRRYERKKMASDPAFAISRRVSHGIRQSLRFGKSGRTWESLVGYSLADLMAHLERQFVKGMTWENRDKWHIDHIVPLSSFRFETPDDPEFKAAWAITNLRPLWKIKNLQKHAKREMLI